MAYDPRLSTIRIALENADVEEIGPGMERSDMLRAVRALEGFTAELKDWTACIRSNCGAAFIDSASYSRHLAQAHNA